MALTVILPLAFLLSIRRSWWVLAIAMNWLGGAAHRLATLGFVLPAAWFV